MRPDDSIEHTGSMPPDADVVLTSRARIARNIAGLPFVHRASEEQCRFTTRSVQQAIDMTPMSDMTTWVDLEDVSNHERRLLHERHLISRQHAESQLPRAVAVSTDAAMSIMVNEEDHVRVQAIATGLQPDPCFHRIRKVDIHLEEQLEWAFHEQLGYQCACPTNVGTGVRFSAMLHLPALKHTQELEKVRQAAKDLRLAVRGYYGEGSESSGNFYQVSNQITLGCSEEELLDRFRNVIVPAIVRYERSAREMLLKTERSVVEDRVHRDLAVLRSARLLKVDEAMKRLSTVRLGVCMGLIDHPSLESVNGLFLQIQSGHLRAQVGGSLGPGDAQAARAELVRRTLVPDPA